MRSRAERRLGIACAAVCAIACASVAAGAAEPVPPPTALRGAQVSWARLQTDSAHWDRHIEHDRSLIEFFRQRTSLNLEPRWRNVSARRLDDLCAHPFLFSENIAVLRGDDRERLAEYLRRGGFILIGACVNIDVTPDPRAFVSNQVATLLAELPDLQVAVIEPGHEIFSIYFDLKNRPPQTRNPRNRGRGYWVDQETLPLHGLISGGRMIGVISLNGLQCGWTGWGTNQNAAECMQMAANIYFYAMTH